MIGAWVGVVGGPQEEEVGEERRSKSGLNREGMLSLFLQPRGGGFEENAGDYFMTEEGGVVVCHLWG